MLSFALYRPIDYFVLMFQRCGYDVSTLTMSNPLSPSPVLPLSTSASSSSSSSIPVPGAASINQHAQPSSYSSSPAPSHHHLQRPYEDVPIPTSDSSEILFTAPDSYITPSAPDASDCKAPPEQAADCDTLLDLSALCIPTATLPPFQLNSNHFP